MPLFYSGVPTCSHQLRFLFGELSDDAKNVVKTTEDCCFKSERLIILVHVCPITFPLTVEWDDTVLQGRWISCLVESTQVLASENTHTGERLCRRTHSECLHGTWLSMLI